jgi:hypothetical protein
LPEPGWECSSTVVLPKVEGSRYRTDTGHAEGDDGTTESIDSATTWPICADCACSSARRSGGRRRDTRGGELMGIEQRSVVPGYPRCPYLISLPRVFFGVGRLCPVRPFGWLEVEHAWAAVFSPCFLHVSCAGSTHGDREALGLALLSPPQTPSGRSAAALPSPSHANCLPPKWPHTSRGPPSRPSLLYYASHLSCLCIALMWQRVARPNGADRWVTIWLWPTQ